MEIQFYLATACLVLFMVLATYDGFYLHIFKYALFNRDESIFEHKTHTARAVLFPLIVWFIMVNETSLSVFLIGIAFVLLDLVVLGIDAYSEKESRSFMGGLPKWEYIVHLFSNAFHFSAIILVLSLKIEIVDSSVVFVNELPPSTAKEIFAFVSINVIPGAIVLALLHFVLMLAKPRKIWNLYRTRITCC
ncbi:MAG: hypothetical protein ACR2MT_09055 [Aurantibacter sp.]